MKTGIKKIGTAVLLSLIIASCSSPNTTILASGGPELIAIKTDNTGNASNIWNLQNANNITNISFTPVFIKQDSSYKCNFLIKHIIRCFKIKSFSWSNYNVLAGFCL